jgi:hypothetical protein
MLPDTLGCVKDIRGSIRIMLLYGSYNGFMLTPQASRHVPSFDGLKQLFERSGLMPGIQ